MSLIWFLSLPILADAVTSSSLVKSPDIYILSLGLLMSRLGCIIPIFPRR